MLKYSTLALSQVSNITKNDDINIINQNPYVNAKIEIKIFQNIDSTLGWGYDIYVSNTQYIHQPHIPAINGNRGFNNKENAERTAEFAVQKIIRNILPPTISINELDSLGVLK